MSAASRQQVAQWLNAAMKHHQANRFSDAEPLYRRVLEKDKRQADATHYLGMLLAQTGRQGEAVEMLRRAVALDPTKPQFLTNLAEALRLIGDREGALEAARRAAQMMPNSADSSYRFGLALQAAGRNQEAADIYRRVIELEPAHHRAYNNLGNVLDKLGKYSESVEMLERGLRAAPQSPQLLANGVLALLKVGLLREAIEKSRLAVQSNPHDLLAQNSLIATRLLDPQTIDQELLDAHTAWADQHAPAGAAPQFSVEAQPDRRLRVGYVSPDFRRHPVAFFLEPLIEHASAAVEVFCYNNAAPADADATTTRFKSYGPQWRDIFEMSDHDAEQLIRQNDRIDILVDVAGHTQKNRLALFARRPAPVQVAYLGYQATTGVRAIEYRLTDALVDPSGEADRYHTEKLIRLNVFACYRPPDDAPAVAPAPCARNGFITFGSYSRADKISEPTLDLWTAAMRRVRDSRLILFGAVYDDAAVVQRYRDLFVQREVDAARIEFVGWQSFEQYFQSHARVDVLLDSIPFNAHTTTCHALWMGVPTITLAGSRYSSRMGLAVLTHLGTPEMIAHNEPEFVEIAARVASAPAELAALRLTLRDRFAASVLMDGRRFNADLEAKYRQIWRTWCERESAQSV